MAEYEAAHVESVMMREDRYIVIKRSDLSRIKNKERMVFSKACRIVHEQMFGAGAPPRQFLVLESDWPEFEPTWVAIEQRVCGTPLSGPKLRELHSIELTELRREVSSLKSEIKRLRDGGQVTRGELERLEEFKRQVRENRR